MAKKQAKTKKRKGGGNPSFSSSALLVIFAIAGVWFMSSAVMIIIGLMPMFVAFFVDRNPRKTKAVTVGAMNIAGLTPFLMELWMGDPSMENALSIILNPMAIIVIYSAAGVGYIIDWVATLTVANFMYQRGLARKKAIEERQAELVKRWGEEVTGKLPLDPEGFPLEDRPEA